VREMMIGDSEDTNEKEYNDLSDWVKKW
jgi:hypothetical protein